MKTKENSEVILETMLSQLEQVKAKHTARSRRSTAKTVESSTMQESDLRIMPLPASAQIPMWPQTVRALPNVFARSALFGVGNKSKTRENLKDEVIASVDGIVIQYRGEELRQDDEDVFLQLLHLARQRPVVEVVEFTRHSMIKALGWTLHSKSYSRLDDALRRMDATSLKVSFGNKGFTGSLIRKFRWQGDDGHDLQRLQCYLEPEILVLFDNSEFSHLFWETRKSLKPVGKWLHGWFASHREPYPIKLETIKRLSGYASPLSKLRTVVYEQLNILQERNFLSQFHIDEDDLVVVKRNPASLELRA